MLNFFTSGISDNTLPLIESNFIHALKWKRRDFDLTYEHQNARKYRSHNMSESRWISTSERSRPSCLLNTPETGPAVRWFSVSGSWPPGQIINIDLERFDRDLLGAKESPPWSTQNWFQQQNSQDYLRTRTNCRIFIKLSFRLRLIITSRRATIVRLDCTLVTHFLSQDVTVKNIVNF